MMMMMETVKKTSLDVEEVDVVVGSLSLVINERLTFWPTKVSQINNVCVCAMMSFEVFHTEVELFIVDVHVYVAVFLLVI